MNVKINKVKILTYTALDKKKSLNSSSLAEWKKAFVNGVLFCFFPVLLSSSLISHNSCKTSFEVLTWVISSQSEIKYKRVPGKDRHSTRTTHMGKWCRVNLRV